MKKISAKILITQLVILCITLFIFPMKLKADEVSYPYFLYNVRHTYEEDNSYVHPFRHKYEFYIHANHEVTGRFIISITTPSGSSAHTWYCESGGEIYNNNIMDRSTGTVVFVTGQQYLKVTLMYLTDSAIDIMNVRSIQFSQTDLDGNIITTDQSLWSEVQKIEDHTFQILSAAGFINDNLTDVRTKLQSVITLLNTTNQSLSTLVTSATNILTKVTSIDTAVQQIDNTIDTISWNENDYTFVGFTTDFNTFSTDQYVSKRDVYYVFAPTNNNFPEFNYNSINNIKMEIVDTLNSNNNKILGIYQVAGSSHNLIQLDLLYENNTRYQKSIYFKTTDKILSGSTPFYIAVKFYEARINGTNFNIKLKTIDETDIEYWTLQGFFEQYNFYKKQLEDNKSILDKLSELILGNTTTNNSVNKNDQSNTQFNQQQQQYDQIESTFQSSFTTDQQAVQQTFNNNTLTIFADTTLWFTQQLTALYNSSGQMKILFTMPLLLGLALFFIGRGAKTSAPNTIDSYYSSEQTANVDGVKYYRVRRTSGAHKVFHGFNRK